MSWKVQLPMMCRLAFHTVLRSRPSPAWSLSNTHLIPPSGPTHEAVDRYGHLQVSHRFLLALVRPKDGKTDQFRQLAIIFLFPRTRQPDVGNWSHPS
jgi:hypothetical protein